MRKAILFGATLALCGCGAVTGDPVAVIGQQAALRSPAVAEGCAAFRSAEGNPRVRQALDAARMVANLAGYGGPAAIAAELRSYGARFCTEGPPAGDVTTDAARASWLAKITMDMLSAAGRVGR